jgi:diaminohydroxyphosphoribosylaminopyrimidine deaminase/5-amino-6-(5-phosphoribosylamino)uracil reductase
MSKAERTWMLRALELAERGRGHVEPNPLVGAVVVREEQIVGEGWHAKYGQAHAEVNALAAAGEAARGATLYVTLEPCCHHGKTPPCTEAVLRAGVARVVAALVDPFPEVAGKGAAGLRAAGLSVDIGWCETEARRINAPYLKLLTTGLPYVIAKWAMTLDGKIATRTNDSKWITSAASRRRVHELRGRMDAIVVGIGTVLADDPLLTARPPGPRTATRIVLDTHGRLPLDCRLAQSAGEAPLLVATATTTQAGEMLALPVESGRVSVPALLLELGRRRMTNVLVEGGAAVLGSFFDGGAVDEVCVFVAPIVIGGGKSAVGGLGVARIVEGLRLAAWHTEMVEGEGDLLLTGRVQSP